MSCASDIIISKMKGKAIEFRFTAKNKSNDTEILMWLCLFYLSILSISFIYVQLTCSIFFLLKHHTWIQWITFGIKNKNTHAEQMLYSW